MAKKLYSVLTALICLLFFAGYAASASPKVNWSLQTVETVRNELTVMACTQMAEEVSKRTNGRFKINVFLAKEIGIDRGAIPQAVARGDIELGVWLTAVGAGTMPHIGIFNLPCFTLSVKDVLSVEKALREMTLKEMKKLGYYPLTESAFWVYSPQNIISKPLIKDISNLKGYKIRVWRELDSDLVRILGGEAIYMPVSEAYQSLQRGVVDAINTGSSAMHKFSLDELAKYYYQVEFAPSGAYVVVNPKKFESLPEEYQKILKEEMDKAIQFHRKGYDQDIITAWKDMQKMGVKDIAITPEQRNKITEGARKVWEKWSNRGPMEKKAYETARKALGL